MIQWEQTRHGYLQNAYYDHSNCSPWESYFPQGGIRRPRAPANKGWALLNRKPPSPEQQNEE